MCVCLWACLRLIETMCVPLSLCVCVCLCVYVCVSLSNPVPARSCMRTPGLSQANCCVASQWRFAHQQRWCTSDELHVRVPPPLPPSCAALSQSTASAASLQPSLLRTYHFVVTSCRRVCHRPTPPLARETFWFLCLFSWL